MGCCKSFNFEAAALAIGIVNSVTSSLLLLAQFGLIFFIIGNKVHDAADVQILIFTSVAFTKCCIDLITATLLCRGILQKKPSNILPYYIYSIVLVVVSILSTVVVAVCGFIDMFILEVLCGLLVVYILVNSLILYVVYRTYENICAQVNIKFVFNGNQFGHKILEES